MEQFYKALQLTPDRACYGQREVQYAVQQRAVQTLLVTDGLFRFGNSNGHLTLKTPI